MDVLTPARPVRADPARGSPCPPPLQPRDHSHTDCVRASDLRQRLAVTAAAHSFLALMVSQLGLPAEADARSKRPGPAFSRPLLLMSSAEHRDGKGPTTLVFRLSTSRAGATEVRTVADVSRG